MEKYSTFTDKNGVNPFVQQPMKRSFGRAALGAVVLFAKVPLAAVAYANLVAATRLLEFPLGPVTNVLSIYVRFVSRVILFLLGIHSVSTITANRNELWPRPGVAAARNTNQPMRNRDIILYNHTSWVDILLLSAAFSPVFAITSSEGGLYTVSLLEAIKYAVLPQQHSLPLNQDISNDPYMASVQEVLLSHDEDPKGPLVILSAEGCPTNGRGVLKFGPVVSQLHATIHSTYSPQTAPYVHVVGIRYSQPAKGEPAIPLVCSEEPAENMEFPTKHCIALASSLSSYKAILVRSPAQGDHQPFDYDLKAPAESKKDASNANSDKKKVEEESGASEAGPTQWSKVVRDNLARVLSRGNVVRPVDMDATTHKAFVDQYRKNLKATASRA